MPIEHVPDSGITYYLIAFDRNGVERADDPDGGILSHSLLSSVSQTPPTDIFLFSHGWKGDLAAAREQYNNWTKAMTTCPRDILRIREASGDFRPLLIGLHWPSLPFGDEEFGSGAAAYDVAALPTLNELVERYADRIADTPAARQAITAIFEAALEDNEPSRLPEHVVAAYCTLNRESGLDARMEGAEPGMDREAFSPELAYQNARASADQDPVSFGGFRLSGLLAPLQQLSFWKMKDRARAFGESGGHALLAKLQDAAPLTRIHLMGHSFGCIVASAIVAGRPGQPFRPIDTLFLVQGAMSLWSFCSSIEQAGGVPGYFRSVLQDKRVAGVTITTQSEYDTAVGRFYPLGAGVACQASYAAAELPKYGAIGAFGIQGPDTGAELLEMRPANGEYAFKCGGVFNIDSSRYIRNGSGASGAHSDIAHPEVAHAFWQAILLAVRSPTKNPEPRACETTVA